jgi:hypothetical protein
MSGSANHGEASASALAPEQSEGAPLRLPPMPVRVEPHEAAEFSRAAGYEPAGGFVPLTFPIRWLALPAVRALILQATGEGFLPVHEAQDFTYLRPLQAGADYSLSVEACRSAKPPRLTVRTAVSTQQDEICVRLETVLRIVPLAPQSAP